MPAARPMAAEREAASENPPDDVAGGRAERHPHADLPRPRRDRLGDQAVDADRGEEERDAREKRKKRRAEALAREGPRGPSLQRHDVEDRHVGRESLDLPADRGGEDRRIACRLHEDRRPRSPAW